MLMIDSRSGSGLLIVSFVVAFSFFLALVSQSRAGESELAGWRRIQAAEIPDNPVKLFGQDWMILAAGKEGDMNAMTIGWGGMGVLWGMTNPVVTVYVEPTRYTREFVDRNEYFTLAVFPEEKRNALKLMGNRSGRDGDKIAESGLTLSYTQSGNPVFNEARMVIECKKIYTDQFDPETMGERGKRLYVPQGKLQPHMMYVGEIVNVWVK